MSKSQKRFKEEKEKVQEMNRLVLLFVFPTISRILTNALEEIMYPTTSSFLMKIEVVENRHEFRSVSTSPIKRCYSNLRPKFFIHVFTGSLVFISARKRFCSPKELLAFLAWSAAGRQTQYGFQIDWSRSSRACNQSSSARNCEAGEA